MKHITYADKSVLVGDHTADLLLEYAAALGVANSADTVSIHAISSDGDDVEAMFLLGQGAPLMSETAHSSLPDPQNVDADTYLRDHLDRLQRPLNAQALAAGAEWVEDLSGF